MQALLEAQAGHITVQLVRAMLSDHTGRPEPICRHAAGTAEWETTSALIAEPVARALHLSYGPPCEGRFITYTAE
jgi:isopenicillin-N N-acyltransferase-like protein